MVLASTRDGLRRAWAVKRLALPLWLANLLVALAVAIPFIASLGDALGQLPLADEAAGELRLGVLTDFLELRPEFFGPFLLAAACAAALALFLSAAVSGGTLEVLLGVPDAPLLTRFGRGAGRYFGRFLRLGALAGLLALVAAALGAALVIFASGSPEDSAWEPARLVSRLGAAAAAFLLALPMLLAFDVARIDVVRNDGRKMRRVLWAALRQVLRRPWRWIGQWALFVALAGVSLVAFWLVRALLPSSGGPALLVVFLAQQAFVLTRAWLRVARFGAQAALLERSVPPVEVPEPAVLEEAPGEDSESPEDESARESA
jgi:hypothetical protein